MRFLADLHVHSKHSRATSPQCDLDGLCAWASRKGVRVVGTGDFTHPAWFRELAEKLEPAEPGLFKLKGNPAPVRFMLTGEISGIYKRGGAVRKVHSLVAVPSLDAAARVNMRLSRIGNIVSDGRPILGLDPRNLLEILLEADPASVLIPAHIWTPWFSMLGSKSGFDSPLECFGELADKVFAVETGLSSDPPMNWRVPCLDRLALVSNSDLHSPQNLGRNANIFFGEPDYHRMFRGLRERDPALCGGTLDLFPEEGKYHLDGHRDCGVVLHPAESRALENICPVCGRELTLGVLHRVEQLADPARVEGERPAGRTLPWRPFIPLPELLGELLDAAPTSLKNTRCYDALLAQFGPEMEVLLDAPLDDIARHSKVPLLDEALRRMREGRVFRSGGYDGVYGEIRVFAKGERDALLGAGDFFNFEGFVARQKKRGADLPVCATHPACLPRHTDREVCVTLDTAQQAAIDAPAFENLLIIAGPGSGKTRVLVQRVARLVSSSGVSPSEILAITFTCRAAAEIRERLGRADSPLPAECPGQPLLEPQGGAQGTARPTIATLHALALRLLREHGERIGLEKNFTIADPATRRPGDTKNHSSPLSPSSPLSVPLDHLIPLAAHLLENHPVILPWRVVCVDEAQDCSPDQWRLLEAFRQRGIALTLIGDPDQSIYGFRGVNVSDFEAFTQKLNPRRVELTRNYRSDATIVEAAAAVIAEGRGVFSTASQPVLPRNRKLRAFEALDAYDEAQFITRDIREHLGGVKMEAAHDAAAPGLGFRDFVVLVRAKSQMKILEAVLSGAGFPVQTIGVTDGFPARPGADELLAIFIAHAATVPTNDIPALVSNLDVSNTTPEARALLPELRDAARAFTGAGVADFLDFLSGWEAVDAYDAAAERVTVMTLHAAKGLEFSVVYVAGCEEGLLPSHDDEAAEERRLFYVAMTRARRELILTRARGRVVYGKRENRVPSRFLAAIPKKLLEAKASRKNPRAKQMELF